jgi:hypothetical protein
MQAYFQETQFIAAGANPLNNSLFGNFYFPEPIEAAS